MNRTDYRGPAIGERRSLLLLLALCLSLATGLALLGAGAVLTDARIGTPLADRSARQEELAGHFYAAVAEAIRTGDPAGLDALVAPAFAWCDPCSDQVPGREGFKRSLVALHEMGPDMHLVAESVVAVSEDTVMARVRLDGGPLMGQPLPLGPVETLRLAAGMIVERRTAPDGLALVDPLVQARLRSLPPAVTGIATARLAFAPGAVVAGLLSAGPTLLVVESGELSFRAGPSARIVRAAGGEEATDEDGARVDGVLRQGDAAIVPAGMRHEFHQRGSVPAVAVGITLFFDEQRSRHLSPRPPDFTPFLPPDRPQPRASTALHPPDVRFLASGAVDAWPRGPVDLAVGRIILRPGVGVTSSASESALIAVEAGTLSVSGDRDRTVAVAAGGGVVWPAGTAREFRNAGDGLLVLLVVTVAAVDG